MKIIHQIDILEDNKLITKLSVASLVVAVLFIPLFVWLAYRIAPLYEFNINIENMSTIMRSLGTFIIIMGGYFIVLSVHELVHGFFFKVFSPKKPLKFGMTWSAAYCVSPESYYDRKQMAVIAITPFLIVNGLMILLYFLGLIPQMLFIIFGILHSAGCVGDFYYIYLLWKSPKGAICQDREDSFTIYEKVGHHEI